MNHTATCAVSEPATETRTHRKRGISRLLDPYPEWASWVLLGLMVASVLIRLFFWHYTHRTWEDALITVLHSENAASGLGLTHLQPPGQPPLHGFTSPLSVLIPLVGDMVHVGWGLPFLKLVSALVAPIAVWLGARILQVVNVPPALALTAAAFLAFEHHQILWGMAGMETEVVTVSYLASIYALQRGTQWQKGLSLGFVMLARPDAAIWVAIFFAFEIWRSKKTGNWRSLLPVIGGLALLYAPWLIFTTLYYGSPIPNTIYAKSLGYPDFWFLFHHTARAQKPAWLAGRLYNLLGGLGLSYGGNGTGFQPLPHATKLRALAMEATLFCAIGAVVAIKRRDVQALGIFAFAIIYSVYLFFCAPVIFGWYTVPVAAAVLMGSLYGFWAATQRYLPAKLTGRFAATTCTLYILAIVSVLPLTFRSDKYLQMYIETGVRKQMGLYLGRVSFPNDTIASESLGYVGYYSRRVIYDYPGLCSRTVIQYLRTHPEHRDKLDMMHTLRPTYIVLRPEERFDEKGKDLAPWIPQEYDLARVFKANPDYRNKIIHPEANWDNEFEVYRLKGAPYNTSAQ